MSLLPDTATFHELVQDCFATWRGRGVALSAVDVELVEAWANTGVPFEVVARGLRRAAENALWDAPGGQGALRSLRGARRDVEAEIQKYLKRAAGKTEETPAAAEEEPFHLVRHKKLEAALKKLAREVPAVAPAVERWVPRLAAPADLAAAARQEELVLAGLLRALSTGERRRLLREARGLVQKAGAISPSARRESLRFHRAALVRHALGLKSFW